MPKIVSLGHIIYDIRCYVDGFPKPDKTAFIQGAIQAGGGGSAANAAVTARMLGAESSVICNIGTDRHGAFLLHDLHKHGVDTRGVNEVDGASGVAIILVNKKADVEVTEMVGVAEPIRNIHESMIAEADHLHLAGCNIDALQKAASSADCTVSFDPGRSKAHLGWKKLAGTLKHADYLILNRHEIKKLAGKNNEREAARFLHNKFGLTCIVKRGGESVLVVGEDSFEAKTFRVKPVVDTIGAGDAFCGAFAVAKAEGKTLEKSVRFANAVAAAKVMHKGTHVRLSRPEIERKFGV